MEQLHVQLRMTPSFIYRFSGASRAMPNSSFSELGGLVFHGETVGFLGRRANWDSEEIFAGKAMGYLEAKIDRLVNLKASLKPEGKWWNYIHLRTMNGWNPQKMDGLGRKVFPNFQRDYIFSGSMSVRFRGV